MHVPAALSSLPPTERQRESSFHSAHKGKKPQRGWVACDLHFRHPDRQTSSCESTTAKSNTYTLCGTKKSASEESEKIKLALALHICITNCMPIVWTESNSFTVHGPSLLGVCFHPYFHNYPFDMALEGTLTLHVMFECPQEVNVTFGPSSLDKAAVEPNMKFRFPEAEFKEIFSYVGKTSTQEERCKNKTPARKDILPYACHTPHCSGGILLYICWYNQLPTPASQEVWNNALLINWFYFKKI